MTDEELIPVAERCYEFLKANTTGPQDGAVIVLMLHVLLWLNNQGNDTSVDQMLENYCADFRDNYEANWKKNLQ